MTGTERTRPETAAGAGGSQQTSWRDAAQVIGVAGAPLLLLLALSAKYAVIQTLGCHHPRASVFVHLIAASSLLGCALFAWLAHWAGAPHATVPRPHERDSRDMIMHVLGLFMCALCAIVIVAQWLPQFALRSCAF